MEECFWVFLAECMQIVLISIYMNMFLASCLLELFCCLPKQSFCSHLNSFISLLERRPSSDGWLHSFDLTFNFEKPRIFVDGWIVCSLDLLSVFVLLCILLQGWINHNGVRWISSHVSSVAVYWCSPLIKCCFVQSVKFYCWCKFDFNSTFVNASNPCSPHFVSTLAWGIHFHKKTFLLSKRRRGVCIVHEILVDIINVWHSVISI